MKITKIVVYFINKSDARWSGETMLKNETRFFVESFDVVICIGISVTIYIWNILGL